MLGKQLERVAYFEVDAIGDSGSLAVATGFFRILLVAVGIDDAATLANCARPPNGGVANGGAQFEDRFRASHHDQLSKDAANSRADNRHIPLRRFRFHLGQHLVARRQQ